MTTKELKSYIDRILGNNVRCLLPSYWWKRAFGAVIDKVDEKLDAANIKTINGESVIGEGNLKVGITTVSSMEELNALEAKIGDIATVASEYSIVNVEECYLPNGENIVAEWDKLTPIRKVEVLGYDGSNNCAIVLSAKVNDFRDCISAVYDAYNNNYIYTKGVLPDHSSIDLSKSEFDALLLENDYRYVSRIIQGELTVDSVFTLYTDSSTADAYIKGDTWTRLLKEGEGGSNITVDSELSETSENPVQNKVVTEVLTRFAYNANGMNIYLALGQTSLSAEQRTTNASTFSSLISGIVKPINCVIVTDTVKSQVPLYSWNLRSDRINLYTSDWDTSNAFEKLKYRLFSDGSTEFLGRVTVDSELSETSENPIQNKAVYAALEEIRSEGVFVETPKIEAKNCTTYNELAVALENAGIYVSDDYEPVDALISITLKNQTSNLVPCKVTYLQGMIIITTANDTTGASWYIRSLVGSQTIDCIKKRGAIINLTAGNEIINTSVFFDNDVLNAISNEVLTFDVRKDDLLKSYEPLFIEQVKKTDTNLAHYNFSINTGSKLETWRLFSDGSYEKIDESENSGGEGGTSVEEIYIGETEPTDENVKVWINPNEQGESAGNGGREFGVPNVLFYYSIETLSDKRKEHNAKAFQQYFALLGKAQVLVMDDILNTVAPGFGILMDETSMLLGVLDIQLPESGNRTNLEGAFYLLTSDGEVAPLDWDSV